uniref:FAM192A/Fyv6 N-terminal domain-containing protein n=1 Tax=Arcella intermedia TaxID=1963864 RepID=A0A6B2LHQ7_9EUKA
MPDPEPVPTSRPTGAPTKPLWEQLKAQKEREEAMWMEEEKVLHAPKGLDDDELIFLEEQQDMKAYMREQQQREIEDFTKQVSETVHFNEPSIVDQLLKVKRSKQKKKKSAKPFVKVVPIATKRKAEEDPAPKDLQPKPKKQNTKASNSAGKVSEAEGRKVSAEGSKRGQGDSKSETRSVKELKKEKSEKSKEVVVPSEFTLVDY